jgi:phage/plasmid-like protein (TIGR03299 family)
MTKGELMSHEMYENDHAVYVGKPAWHGLGTVVEEAPSIWEALRLAKMDFEVVKSLPIQAWANGECTEPSKFRATVRTDTNEILGIVNKNYQIVQNHELFGIASSLGNDAVLETAGTLHNGAQSYLLMKLGEWAVNGNDEMHEYMCLMNSHNGTLSLSGLPTDIRVVCSNTLNWAISEGSQRMIKIRHSGDLDSKILGLKEALGEWKEHRAQFRTAIQTLGRTQWTQEEIRSFWIECYEMFEEPIARNPQTDKEEKNKTKAVATFNGWANTFDTESNELGNSNAWIAANAVTQWLQHKPHTRGRVRTTESTIGNKLIGQAAKDTSRVMRRALELV